MKKYYIFLIIMVLFSACNSDSNNTDINANKPVLDFSGFKIGATEVLENTNTVGSVADSEMSNKNNPIDLEAGKTYSVKVNVSTDTNYSDGLGFNVTLVQSDANNSEDAYSELVGSYSSDTAFATAGDHTIEVEIYLPYNMPSGLYLMVTKSMDADLERISIEQKNITEIPELGAVFVNVKESTTNLKLTTTEVNGTNYLDLPYTSNFKNGYTNQDVATSQLSFFNQSLNDENITVSGKLVLEGGTEVQLGILDTNESDVTKSVKESVLYTIGANEGGDNGEFDIDISYYIPEDKYASLIALLPDLSLNANNDGLSGTITWTITASNVDLVTNNIDESLILSKFLKTLDTDSSQSSSKLSNSLNQKAVTSASTLLNALKDPETEYSIYNVDTAALESNWTAISGITNLTFESVDAAYSVDGTDIYLFSGKEYVVYNKDTQSVGAVQTISSKFTNLSFETIDAAFYRASNKKLYLFSGNEYVRLDPDASTVDSSYPKSLTNVWSGVPSSVDAAKLSRSGKTAFFYKGTKRYDYSFSDSNVRSTKTVDDAFTAITIIDTVDKNIRFKKAELDAETKLLSEGLLFKYTGDFTKKVGKKKRIALAFENEYSTEGAWKVPGVTGKASSNINLYLFKKKATILGVEAEAAIALSKKYQGITGENKSRIGGRITSTILGSTYYEKNTISEEEASDEIDPDSSNSAKQSDIDTATAKSEDKSFTMPSYEWSEEVSLISTTVAVGPIPLSLEGGVQGSMAVNTGFGFDGVGVALTASVPANLDTFVSAGLGIKWAQAGIRGEATLLKASGDASLGAYLKLVENDFVFSIGSKVTSSLQLLQGRLALFAAAKLKIKWCGFVPCGLKWYEWQKYIYRSKWLYNNEWTLLEKDIPVLKLPLK